MFNPIAQIIRKLRDRVENTDGVALPDGIPCRSATAS